MDITSFVLGLQKGKSMGGGTSPDVRYVTFIGADGAVLYKKPVAVGDDCVDVLSKGLISTPTKESTVSQTFTYSGWSLTNGGAASSAALKAVTEDRTVYAAFTASARKYTVRFYDGATLMQTSQVAYGTKATPPDTLKDGYVFVEWTPSDLTIYGDTDFVGTWEIDQGWLIMKEFPETAATTPYGDFVYSLDGTRLYTAYSKVSNNRGAVCMFDTTTEPYTLLKSVEVYGMTTPGYGSGTCHMAISPDGKWLALTRRAYANTSSYIYANHLEVFNISGNTLTKTSVIPSTNLSYTCSPIDVAFSPDSKYLYLAGYDDITRFTVGTTASTWTYSRSQLRVANNVILTGARKIAISLDGTKLILVKGSSSVQYGIEVYDLTNGYARITDTYLNRSYGWTDLAFSHDGKYLVCARETELNGTTMEVFDTTTTPYTSVFVANVGFVRSGVSFSSDDKLLAFATDASPYLRIFDVDTWTEKDAPRMLPGGISYNCTFNNNGTRLILSHENAPYVALYEVKQ